MVLKTAKAFTDESSMRIQEGQQIESIVNKIRPSLHGTELMFGPAGKLSSAIYSSVQATRMGEKSYRNILRKKSPKTVSLSSYSSLSATILNDQSPQTLDVARL